MADAAHRSDLVVLAMTGDAVHRYCQGGLAGAGRAPEQDGGEHAVGLDGPAQCDATHRRLPGPRMVLGATTLR